MVSIVALLSRAAERVDSLLPLAVVPFVLAALSFDKFGRIVAANADFRFGITFGFPTTVSSSWAFVNVPQPSPGPTLPAGGVGGTVLVLLAVTVLSAALGAGYLGSLRREFAGVERSFLQDSRAYFGPFLGFELVHLALVLAGLLAALVAVPLGLLVLPLLFAFAYLFYATPYLVVVDGIDLPSAFRRSYEYATSGGKYASFFVQYLVGVGLVSVVATPLFSNSVIGGAIGVVVLAPVALLFDAATMLFVHDLTGATGHEGPTAPGTAPGGQSNMPVET
jgi:hypothetical protein